MLQILTPHALDDAGAVCAAMMKAQMKDKSLKLQDMIDNYFHFIMYKEHRLADGTFARNRPYHNTLWLDDMFMGIPSVALMGRYASDHNDKYYQEAVRQILQFAERMFVPEKACSSWMGRRYERSSGFPLGTCQRMGYSYHV